MTTSLTVSLFIVPSDPVNFFINICNFVPQKFHLGAVHILRNTEWGGGLPDLIQYYIGWGLPNLLQYYIGGVLKVYYNITVLKGKWKVIFLFQL